MLGDCDSKHLTGRLMKQVQPFKQLLCLEVNVNDGEVIRVENRGPLAGVEVHIVRQYWRQEIGRQELIFACRRAPHDERPLLSLNNRLISMNPVANLFPFKLGEREA